MSNLFRNNWSLGWTPNSSDHGGDPRGLLRADNLTWRDDGTLTLIRGTKKISSGPFASWATQIFSRTLGTGGSKRKLRYIVSGVDILRNYGGANSETIFDMGFITGASGEDYAGFGFGSGHIFVTYGNQKRKDDGINQSDIGIDAPNPPTLTANPQPTLIASPDSTNPSIENYVEWEAVENEVFGIVTTTHVEIDSDIALKIAIAMRGLTNTFDFNADNIAGIPNTGTEDDTFSMRIRIGDTTKFIKVIVAFLLTDPTVPTVTADTPDFYQKEWSSPSTIFNQGIDQWTTISARKKDFERIGTNSALSWKNIRGIKVTFVTTEYQKFMFNGMKFTGGINGVLTGQYQYYQVDVQNNGYYTEKSLPSVASSTVDVYDASINVTPQTVDPDANECWIFRQGENLPVPYLIQKIMGAKGFTPAPFVDKMSDDDVLLQGIQLDLFQENLPDGIIGMECNWRGRNWYITYDRILPSFRDNLSSFDSRYVVENTEKNVESNYFITRLNNDVLIVATNVDFYEITGTTGIIIQDGIEFFDINIKALGIKSPAISRDFTIREGNLFYLASDGVRVLSGSSCTLLTNPIDSMFTDIVRYGISRVKIKVDLTERYFVSIAKNKLYFSTPLEDNSRALFVYDIDLKIWQYEDHGDVDSIAALWVEEDETILYSTASFGDKFLRILDIDLGLDQTSPIPYTFLTVWDDNGQPRNRKDSFTLKVVAHSLNTDVIIKIRGFTQADKTADSNEFREQVFVMKFNGVQEKIFSIYDIIATVKSYQIEISGSSTEFKLYNFSIDYEARPEQLSQLRVPPSTFGIAGRKRLSEIPFIIDCLGNEIHFVPILDGIAQTESTHGGSDKALAAHFFLSDISAFNVGALIYGTLFEFYELVQPREIELLPDPVKYKLVPYTNLGSGSRKRFIQYALVIDTRGFNVTMTPYIDGVEFPIQTINTNFKRTIIYTFDSFAIGVDIAATLSGSNAFEFYEVNLSECISEKLPPLASHLHIPFTNLSTSARKRMSQFAFMINTFGKQVTFTPNVDGFNYQGMTFSTDRKQTVIYTFTTPVAGIDFGGFLEATNGIDDFEYYGPNFEEMVYEKLPAKAKSLDLSCTNFGIAAPKRIRTIPMVLNTFGSNVTYQPYVDGVAYPTSIFNTTRKATVLHYFNESNGTGTPFGIDYCGTLTGASEFEFYEILKPENVETLPVGKTFDQFGPVEFTKVGKIREISIRIVASGSTLNFRIYASDAEIMTGSVATTVWKERTYKISCPKGINPNIFRMELWSSNVFHRFDCAVKVNIDGAQTENKWIKIK